MYIVHSFFHLGECTWFFKGREDTKKTHTFPLLSHNYIYSNTTVCGIWCLYSFKLGFSVKDRMYLLLAYPLQAISVTLFLQQPGELPECLGIWDTDTYCWDTVAPISSVTYNWEKQTQVLIFSFSLFSFSTFSSNVSTGNHAESICLLKTVTPQLSGSFFLWGRGGKGEGKQ